MRKGTVKLKKQQVDALCDLISKGTPVKYATQAVNLPEGAFYRYLQNYREGKAVPSIVVELCERVKKAEAEAVIRNIRIVQEASKTSWQASAWWLERRHPESFAKREYVGVQGVDDINPDAVEAEDGRIRKEIENIIGRKLKE